MTHPGANLIFLASQPRAGSTMLQRMLGAHTDVHTVSEPWMLLPPLFERAGGVVDAAYDAEVASTAHASFVAALPDGEDDVYEGLRRMYGYLYDRALEGTGKTRFLDKTPRYYYVLPELRRLFPAARHVVLLRHPLAVLASMLSTWVKGDDWKLLRYRDDLRVAPPLLAAPPAGTAVVRYEALVEAPEDELRRLCEVLDLPFESGMVRYGEGTADADAWRLGDRQGVRRHARPVTASTDRWVAAAEADPQTWRYLHDYLLELGPALMERLGYDFDEARGLLEARRPGERDLWATFSLRWALSDPDVVPRRWRNRALRLGGRLRRLLG